MRLVLSAMFGVFLAGCAQQGAGDAAEPDAQADAPAAAPQAAADPPPQQEKHFLKREAKLVDKNKVLAENPKLVEVENKINASDPLTAVSQGYFSAASQIHAMNLQNTVRQLQALNDRWPTFEEFEDVLRQSGMKLQGLYAWQVYAYDDQTGDISILEDRAEKKRQYEEAGRDYPHDD